MMKAIFEVVKPGLSTSIQDLGRIGFQKYGVSPSGAMDYFSFQTANILVGNHPNDAVMEVMMMGPHLAVLADCIIAIGGADLAAELDGKAVYPWKTYHARKGQELTFGKQVSGTYAYLAVAGGIFAETVMDSKSTYIQAKIGGYKGRILQKSDQVYLHREKKSMVRSGRYINRKILPDYEQDRPIRVLTGPDTAMFSNQAYQQFYRERYRITGQSNRMGYRLAGKAIPHVEKADIISDAVLPGTIQVPSSGQPIILLAERQTTGGYARIATVITADIPYLVQKRIGSEIQFLSVSLDRAQRDYLQMQRFLQTLRITAGCSISNHIGAVNDKE